LSPGSDLCRDFIVAESLADHGARYLTLKQFQTQTKSNRASLDASGLEQMRQARLIVFRSNT
jgi:hypothetical protein